MKFDDYACFRLSHDPNDPSINDIVDDRVRAMCDDWNLASCSGHRLKDELEDIARLRFLVAITTEYMGIMTSRGFNAPCRSGRPRSYRYRWEYGGISKIWARPPRCS